MQCVLSILLDCCLIMLSALPCRSASAAHALPPVFLVPVDNQVDCQGHIAFTCCHPEASVDPIARLCVLMLLLSCLITLLLSCHAAPILFCYPSSPPPSPPHDLIR